MQNLLTIQNLAVDFIGDNSITHALTGISFTVGQGEIVAVVGESGSGKSVTSLAVLQLLPPPPSVHTSGNIFFEDDDSIEESTDEKIPNPKKKNTIDLLACTTEQMQHIRGNRIAMIFQEPMTSLNPVKTCGSQVAEAITAHKNISATGAKQLTLELFERVKLPDPPTIFNKYPHQLSGGQKQRVMIAMAMSCNPALLICDEPTTALDATVQKSILQLIKSLQQQNNMGVIFISHDLGVVSEIANRIVVMYKGNIVEQGTCNDVIHHPQHPYTKALLACRPGLHKKGGRLPVVSDYLSTKLEVRSTKGSTNEEIPKPNKNNTKEENAPSGPLLEVRGLSVYYPLHKTFLGRVTAYTKAVNNVSFTVRQGETLGLVGESGCGKTTLGRAVLGLLKPTEGSIYFKGANISTVNHAAWIALRKDMQLIFQDPYSSLNPRKTIGAAIAEPLLVHGLYHNAKQRKEKVIDLLQKTGLLLEHYNRYPHEFSGGQRQRIVIARALALEPTFIVCDEMVSALDVSVQAQVLNLLNDLKKTFAFTAIFISHDLNVVRYMCDRVLVMHRGIIEESGDAEDVYTHPKTAYTKQLIESMAGMV